MSISSNAREHWASVVLDSAQEAVLVLDADLRVRFLNRAAALLLQLDMDQAVGRVFTQVDLRGRAGESYRLVTLGTGHVVEAMRRPLAHGGEHLEILTLRDNAEQPGLSEMLRAALLVDRTTGLLNRRGFLLLSQHQLQLAQRSNRGLILTRVRVPKKETGPGKEAEQALLAVTAAMRQSYRDCDILCRYADDEFVALAVDARLADGRVFEERIRRSLQAWNATRSAQPALEVAVVSCVVDPYQSSLAEVFNETPDKAGASTPSGRRFV